MDLLNNVCQVFTDAWTTISAKSFLAFEVYSFAYLFLNIQPLDVG